MLLASSSQNEANVVDEGEDTAYSELSRPASSPYEKLVEVMAGTMTKLVLVWGQDDTGSGSRQILMSDSLQAIIVPALYVAAGQASSYLHKMTVRQEYQTDMLKDLDQGQGLSLEAVAELTHGFGPPGYQKNCQCH